MSLDITPHKADFTLDIDIQVYAIKDMDDISLSWSIIDRFMDDISEILKKELKKDPSG